LSGIRVLDTVTVEAAVVASRSRERRRANHNLHPALDDPIQRFLNVLQPDSYVRPHRHEADRFELFLVLAGRAAAILFDAAGAVIETVALAPDATRAVEIPGGRWHTLLALEPDTVLFEVKPGPYRPLTDKDFASWAPAEGDPAAAAALERWRQAVA